MPVLKFCFLLLLSSLLIIACSESNPEPYTPEDKTSFQPLNVGNEWIYDVDSIIVYLGGDFKDTSSVQIRDRIIEKEENESLTVYTLMRSHRSAQEEAWRDIEIWKLEQDEDRLYSVQSNRRFIKLVYPFKEGTSWDPTLYFDKSTSIAVGPNAFNFYLSWQAEVDRLEDGIATIKMVDNDNIYRKVYAEERYTENVGLSYLEYLDYNINSSTPDERPWEEKIDYGFKVVQELVDYTIR